VTSSGGCLCCWRTMAAYAAPPAGPRYDRC
jgi:hypothetical protein